MHDLLLVDHIYRGNRIILSLVITGDRPCIDGRQASLCRSFILRPELSIFITSLWNVTGSQAEKEQKKKSGTMSTRARIDREVAWKTAGLGNRSALTAPMADVERGYPDFYSTRAPMVSIAVSSLAFAFPSTVSFFIACLNDLGCSPSREPPYLSSSYRLPMRFVLPKVAPTILFILHAL